MFCRMKRAIAPSCDVVSLLDLPDEVISEIIALVLSERFNNYPFSFFTVNKRISRIASLTEIDWLSAWKRWSNIHHDVTQQQARVMLFLNSEKMAAVRSMNTIVFECQATYRSHSGKVSRGVLSMKKMKTAKYPNAATKQRVMLLLKEYNRLHKILVAFRSEVNIYW